MTKPAGLSLSDLNVTAKTEAVEYEYIPPSGESIGVFISLLSSQHPDVVAATNREINARRRRDMARAAQSRRQNEQFTPVEEDLEFGQKAAAARMVGWRGISEEFTTERALQLCQGNPDITQWALEKSNELGFTLKGSPAS